VFSIQDANGDYRPLFLQASCATLAQLASANGPLGETVLNLTPILTSTKLCPKQAAADAKDYQLYKQGKLSTQQAHSGAQGLAASNLKNVPFLPKLPSN
jgi:hypothetical protein